MPVGPDLLLTNVYVGALGVERLGDVTVNTVLLGEWRAKSTTLHPLPNAHAPRH